MPTLGQLKAEPGSYFYSMDRDELIEKMRGRIATCRNLARTADPKTAEALRRLADEGQRDLDRLLADRSG